MTCGSNHLSLLDCSLYLYLKPLQKYHFNNKRHSIHCPQQMHVIFIIGVSISGDISTYTTYTTYTTRKPDKTRCSHGDIKVLCVDIICFYYPTHIECCGWIRFTECDVT